MDGPYPTVAVGDDSITIRTEDDVRTLFTMDADLDEGDEVDDYTVERIDADLNYVSVDEFEGDKLEVRLHLRPIDTLQFEAFIDDADISIDNWNRIAYFTTNDGLFGIEYRRRIPH